MMKQEATRKEKTREIKIYSLYHKKCQVLLKMPDAFFCFIVSRLGINYHKQVIARDIVGIIEREKE